MSHALDPETCDLATSRAKLLDDLIVVPQTHGDQTFYHIDAPSRARYFRIGYAEYVFLSLLDGRTTFAQAVTLTARALGADALTQNQAQQVYHWAIENGVARFVDSTRRHVTNEPRRRRWLDAFARLNPLWIKLPLGRPDPLLNWLSRGLGWMFSIPGTLLGLSLALVATAVVVSGWDRFSREGFSILSRDNWLWLGIAWVMLKLVHELAHGLAAKRYRGVCGDMGVLLAFLTPSAYIDVSSCWRFVSKWQRIHVAAAGMYVELVIASILVLVWSRTDAPETAQILRDVVLMAGVTTMVFNSNPLMRLDGYYILADFLEIPNLATEGQRRLVEGARWLWFGEHAGAPRMRGWRGRFIAIYGVAAAGWRVVVWGSLLVAASVFARGGGSVLCAVALACWFAQPAWQCLQLLSRQFRDSPWSFYRAVVVSMTTAAACAAAWSWLPWPGILSAPGIVDYQNAAVVRSHTTGFVTVLHVSDGQLVTAGTLLLELRNEELDNELRGMELQARQIDVQRRIALEQGHPGESQVCERNLRAIEEHLADLRRRHAGLQVRAPSSGRVIARNLDQWLFRYVKEGQALFIIGSDTSKELVLAIPQGQLANASKQIGQPVRYRIGARASRIGILDRIEPRATREIPHPALAVNSGGPLAVTQTEHHDGSRQLRLVEPRFRAIVTLDADKCNELACGEQGHAMLGRSPLPFGKHLWRLCALWLRDFLREA